MKHARPDYNRIQDPAGKIVEAFKKQVADWWLKEIR